jgi:hypothetical protein
VVSQSTEVTLTEWMRERKCTRKFSPLEHDKSLVHSSSLLHSLSMTDTVSKLRFSFLRLSQQTNSRRTKKRLVINCLTSDLARLRLC